MANPLVLKPQFLKMDAEQDEYSRPERRGVKSFGVNYFKIMQIFIRNLVYTPNFGLKTWIFLRFAPPFSNT